MTLILFVCRGNTCRSPMAEAAARAHVEAMGRPSDASTIAFGSAGISVAEEGRHADSRAIGCMARRGLDLSAHRTRLASLSLLKAADRIFVMDRGIRDHLAGSTDTALTQKLALLTSLVPDLGVIDIEDPWNGTADDYERAFGLIWQATEVLAADLIPAVGNIDSSFV